MRFPWDFSIDYSPVVKIKQSERQPMEWEKIFANHKLEKVNFQHI